MDMISLSPMIGLTMTVPILGPMISLIMALCGPVLELSPTMTMHGLGLVPMAWSRSCVYGCVQPQFCDQQIPVLSFLRQREREALSC